MLKSVGEGSGRGEDRGKLILPYTHITCRVVGNVNVKDAVKEGSGCGLGVVVVDGDLLLKPRGKKILLCSCRKYI